MGGYKKLVKRGVVSKRRPQVSQEIVGGAKWFVGGGPKEQTQDKKGGVRYQKKKPGRKKKSNSAKHENLLKIRGNRLKSGKGLTFQ